MADGDNAEPLPALLFAGAYITGGIVGYDSDTKSGGIGARILGIQANTQYRQDVVTIILRLVNVQSGEVVISTTIEKTIFSTGKGADIFKYFDADTMLLESEAGVARNEPVTFAVRKAIEAGVAEIIHQGAKKEIWKIKLPPEPEVIEESDAEVVTDEQVKVDLTVEQTVVKVKTREEYLEEKKLRKEQQRLQKVEIAKFNEVNGTKFKTWEEYQTYLKHIAALELKFLEKENRKALIQLNIHEEKAALEVADESVIIESNTDTSNSD
jgi:hypothetical protein